MTPPPPPPKIFEYITTFSKTIHEKNCSIFPLKNYSNFFHENCKLNQNFHMQFNWGF